MSDEHVSGVIRSFLADVIGLAESQFDAERQFAELGLDSFGAQQLRRLLFQHTGAELPLTSFLGAQTPRSVIDALHVRSPSEPPAPAPPYDAPSADPSPPSDLEEAPLTAVQAAYWVGRRPDFPLGNVATFWYQEFDRAPADRDGRAAESDVDLLEAAWNRLVDHHPMLRATVGRDGRQRCGSPGMRYVIGRTDLRELAPPAVEQCLARLRHERSHQLRDPQRWPLFDLHAIYLPDGTTRLLLGFDILVLDFASWRLLMVQWGQVMRDPGMSLPAPPTRFLDTVRHRLTDPAELARRERARQYWLRRLDTIPPGPQLPLRQSIDQITAPRFARCARTLAAADWARLRARCAEHGVSPTAALLAAFGLTLHRWGATDRFALNATLFDRPEDIPGVEQVVGDFTTTTLVGMPAIEMLRWPGFAEYARQVNHDFWEAIDHRAFSAVELLRELPGGPAGSDAVTHPVVFTSGLGVGDESTPARWLGTEVFGLSQTPQVLMDHLVWQEDDALRIVFDAVTDAFPEGFVDGIADAEHRLLRLLSAEADAWTAADLGWAPDYSRQEPLRASPFPGAGPLLDDPRRDVARRRPDTPALLTPGTALTHGELDRRAQEVAAYLAGLGVRTNDLVLVALPKGPAQIIAVLGTQLAGAGYVPVNPDWPAARIAAVCERAGITRAVLLDGAAVALPGGVRAGVVDRDGRPVPPPQTPLAGPAGLAAPDDLAYVIFTSGSTGVPKGVAVEHRQARTTIDEVTDRFGINAGDRLLGLSALSFDLSVYDIFGLLGAGGALVLPDESRQRDPQHWCELIGRFDVTVWNTAPALLEILVEYAESDPGAARELSSLRLVMLSGDWIPVTLPDRLRGLVPGARVASLGGATEASIWSITYPIDVVRPEWPSIPYGRPLRAQFFHILDEAGRPCPVGEVGELYIAGDGVARGYLGDPVQTWERFVTHPMLGHRLYRTGDLGRWRYDGTIQFMGRADRQVKVNGHRIELGEIETVLGRLPAVRQAVASALSGPDGRPRLVAYVTTSEPADERVLASALRERLPDYMVPSRLVLLDDMPVTDNGKVDYRRLPNPFHREPAGSAVPAPSDAGPAAPVGTGTAASIPTAGRPPALPASRSPLPAEPSPLAEAIRDILGGEVDMSAGLVAAGATSLAVVRLANAIEDVTGARPSFQDLVAYPSVTALVEAYPVDPPDRADAGTAGSAPARAGELRLDPPRGMDLALRMRLPSDRPLADALVDAGQWLHHVRGRLVGSGYHVHERFAPGDGDVLEIRLTGATDVTPATDAIVPTAAVAEGGGVLAGDVRAAAKEPFPLTEMQLAYLLGRADTWLGSQVAPHYYTEVDVHDLDRDRLAEALRRLVERHPMLRAVITPDTRQVVTEAPAQIPMTVVDLRREPAEVRQERLRRMRHQRSHAVADPTRWPLFQIGVSLIDDDIARLHFGLDLLFCDAQSAVIVAEELFTIYARPEALPPAPAMSFVDWVAEVQAAERGERRQRALEYWRGAATDMADGPALPLRTPAEARYLRRRAILPRPDWQQLRQVAHAAGVTPAGLLLTAFCDVLRMAGAGDRFTLVLTTFDRPAAHRGVVGDYTSTVLLDIDQRHQQSFANRATALQQRLWADLEHATGPHGVHGNEVLRELSARRRRQVLLPVVFSSGLGSTVTADGRGVDASELLAAFGSTVYAISQTPRVALDNQIFEHEEELRINWDAVDAAFPPGYLDTLLDAYLLVLRTLSEPARWQQADPAGLAGVLAGARQTPQGWSASPPAPAWPAVPPHRRLPGRATATARRVAQAIATELATDPEALPHDNSFFDLGATSLTLVRVHRRLRAELGDRLTVLDLFTHPSIRALAAYVDQSESSPPSPPDASDQPGRGVPAPAPPEWDSVLMAARQRGLTRRERLAAR
ncbi:amino acid adenylation domain-containing protein [Actinomycetes bacterium KLBMP 9797]